MQPLLYSPVKIFYTVNLCLKDIQPIFIKIKICSGNLSLSWEKIDDFRQEDNRSYLSGLTTFSFLFFFFFLILVKRENLGKLMWRSIAFSSCYVLRKKLATIASQSYRWIFLPGAFNNVKWEAPLSLDLLGDGSILCRELSCQCSGVFAWSGIKFLNIFI